MQPKVELFALRDDGVTAAQIARIELLIFDAYERGYADAVADALSVEDGREFLLDPDDEDEETEDDVPRAEVEGA